MQYNYLGNTGLQVSELCFGTMTFGSGGEMWDSIGTQEQEEANELLEQAVQAGVNFIDTANIYSFGQSEKILGNALKDADIDRDRLVIATKVRGDMGEGENQGGLSRYHVLHSVEQSLQRLQLEHLDILYVHGWDESVEIEEVMRTLNQVVADGDVRYLGVSNWPSWAVTKANAIARANGWHQFRAGQYYYSLGGRGSERSIIPALEEENIGLMPWSPLAGGFMTGKYTDTDEETGGRRDEFDFPPIDKEEADEVVHAMEDIADDKSVSVAEIALAWVRHQPSVTSTIIGAKNSDQLASNLASVEVDLSDDELKTLNEISALKDEYPGWMIEQQS
jgi:aryl-alcohol dehydrogenase-like predicted oxidoreductase